MVSKAPSFMARRPERTECDEYYHRYISLVPDGDVVATLEHEFPVTIALLETVPAARETRSYAPGKWTFREALGHLTDMERLFALRALWIARDPATPLPSFEQEMWAADRRPRAAHRKVFRERYGLVGEPFACSIVGGPGSSVFHL